MTQTTRHVLLIAILLSAVPAALLAKPAYKRVHIATMKALLTGEYDKAASLAEKVLAKTPDDPETLYCLAIAQAQLKDVPKARATAAAAVKAGLPIGRFFAGPRKLVAPLVADGGFGELAKKAGFVGLVHGPLLGCVTDTSAKIWVRTATEVPVTVVCAKSADLGSPACTATVKTRADRDYTAVIPLTKLEADTVYHYDVRIGGKEFEIRIGDKRVSTWSGGKTAMVGGKPWSFRTFTPGGRKAKFVIGFAGGAGYVPVHERVWDTILKHKPRAFLQLGDNVYIDQPKFLGIHHYCYYRRQSRPEYRRLVATAAIYAIWDDHDFGTNDCWGGPEIDQPEWKIPVWRIFRDNWNNPSYGGGEKQPGCWFDFSIGDVDFFMTDGRYYRTAPRKTPKDKISMLGPVQKKWLLARLKASKATFKVIASGTPWTFLAKGKSLDTWNGFQAEREEIFSCIEANKIGGVVLLSADRHRSDVWKIPRKNGYDFYEFESSRLTNQHVHPTMKKAMFSWNGHGFGLLTFDTAKADPQVTYRIVSIDNKVIHTFTVKKSQLTHK